MLDNLVVRLLPGILPGVQAVGRYRVSMILTLRTLDKVKLFNLKKTVADSRNLKYRNQIQNVLELQNVAVLKYENKTANTKYCLKNCSLVLTATDQKPQKIFKRVILLSITLTFRRRDGG